LVAALVNGLGDGGADAAALVARQRKETSRLLFPSFRFFIFLSCYIDSLGDVFIDALTI
jgi:hypothetical protein